jgi:aquaporin Z
MSLVKASIVEFIGTFIFLTVILNTANAMPIGIALAAVIFAFGAISGGHFNPAVSFMMFVKGNISAQTFGSYVVAQLLGAYAAYLLFKNTTKKHLH